jgi:phage recombination protein Bet
MPQNVQVSNEQIAAFLAVANEYGLNPFTKEIYAFPTRGGGIQPIVGVDGWLDLMNRHMQYDGMDKPEYGLSEDGKLESCTLTIYRKDRGHPTVHTEWYQECKRDTEPWKQMPRRMLLNRTTCQIVRRAFGFAGIMDEDEASEINITAQSTEISRETNTKTEALKEKIGARKAKATEPNPPSTPPVDPAPTPTPEPMEAPPIDMAAELQEAPPQDDPERVLNETEYSNLLALLRVLGTTEEKKQAAIKAARAKFLELGYPTAKAIKLRDYAGLVDWASSLKV